MRTRDLKELPLEALLRRVDLPWVCHLSAFSAFSTSAFKHELAHLGDPGAPGGLVVEGGQGVLAGAQRLRVLALLLEMDLLNVSLRQANYAIMMGVAPRAPGGRS